MTMARILCLPILIGVGLSACQSSQSRQAELARICADPANRQPGNFYSVECQSLYPLTNQQRQRNYRLGAPTGD